jgi:hypothetical protein
MVYVRLFIVAEDGNINCLVGAARDLGKTIY